MKPRVLLNPWTSSGGPHAPVPVPDGAEDDPVHRYDQDTDRTLLAMGDPEEHGRDEYGDHDRDSAGPETLSEPCLQIPAIGEFLSEGS